jgi:hypothetical protein
VVVAAAPLSVGLGNLNLGMCVRSRTYPGAGSTAFASINFAPLRDSAVERRGKILAGQLRNGTSESGSRQVHYRRAKKARRIAVTSPAAGAAVATSK